MTPSLSLVTWSVLLATPISAQAVPKSCSPTDSKDCVQPLFAGELAPFDGQLLTPRRAAKLAVLSGQCGERIHLAQKEAQALGRIDLDLERQLRANDALHWGMEKKLLQEALAGSRRSWYEHPGVTVFLTVVGTSLVYVVAVRAIEATTTR